MLPFKVVFLTLSLFAVYSYASDDDDFVELTSDETEGFLGVTMALMAKMSYDADKKSTLEGIMKMLKTEKNDVIMAATQNIHDISGNLLKTNRIQFKIPLSRKVKKAYYHDSDESYEKVDKDDVIIGVTDIAIAIEKATDIKMVFYGTEYDDNSEIKQRGYINKELTVLGDKDHQTYNFTAITTEEEMEKILEQFNSDLTKVYRDVDGKIVKNKSSFSYSNGFVIVGDTSTYIPPMKVIQDAMAGFTRIALMYPDEITKHMTKYLKAKNNGYQYIMVTDFDDYSLESDHWFQLKYNDFEGIPDIFIFMKKKAASV